MIKDKKLNKLRKMQVHIIKQYYQYCYGEKIVEIAFPKIWNRDLQKRWLNNNGYEEFVDRSFSYDDNYCYALTWEFRKNKAYITYHYNV